MSVNFKPALRIALVSAFMTPMIAGAVTPAPSDTLYGGGATLPAIGYVGNSWLTNDGTHVNNPQLRLTNPAGLGSLFGAFTAATPPASTHLTNYPNVSYCQTGSGGGRKIFYGLTGFAANQACGDYTTSNKNGFSAPNAEPNFAASDAPLSASEYNQFITNKGATHAEPVQIPEIAGAIGVIYANSDTAVSSKINLTESQICQIFKGTINNWNQISPSFQNKAIKLVYRSDDSGTSFNFTNHLSKVCPSAFPTAVSGISTQSTFVNIYPGATAPTGAIGGSGNGGVVQAVQTTDGSIGYAEIQDAVERGNLAGSKVNYATVSIRPDVATVKGGAPGITYKKLDPTSLSNTFKIPAGGVLTDMVITGNDSNGRPVLASIASATSPSVTPPQAGCLFVAAPDAVATAATKTYTKTNSFGTTTYDDYLLYPIVAPTYLLAYNTGNGANTAGVQGLMTAGLTAAIKNTVSTIGKNSATGNVATGFAYLTGLPSGIAGTVKGCIKN